MPPPNMVIGMLNDAPIYGASAARWALAEGTKPFMTEIDVSPSDAKRLSSSFSPIKLTMDIGGTRKLEVSNVWVLKKAPTDDPYIDKVTIADRRWFWEYKHILRRLNMRRRVGVSRVRPDNHDELDPGTVTDQTWYAFYSLKNPDIGANGKWTPKEALESILQEVSDYEKANGGKGFNILYSGNVTSKLQTLPVEQLQIDERADMAIARLLGYFPMLGLYIDLNGDVVLYDRSSGDEVKQLTDMTDGLDIGFMGMGWIEYVENRITRPRAVHVLFSRELEVRFDFTESESVDDTTAEPGDRRICENVLPVPDFSMTLANGTTLAQGTWVTFDEAMNSQTWASPPGLGIPKLDHPFLQRAFVPYMDLWASLELSGKLTPNSDWSARIAAIQQHWRRTFRINKRWLDRTFAFRMYRVATIDPVKGQRAPAQAFADHAYIASQRSKWRDAQNNRDISFAINVDGYPPGGLIGSGTRATPAFVSLLDEDQGIVHVDYRVDPNRVFEMVLPSQVNQASMPVEDPTDRSRSVAFNAIANSIGPGNFPRMSSSHKIAFIFTGVPASPNTVDQLHRVVVRPDDVKSLLPPNVAKGLSDATGPIMEIRVGNGVETARVAWSDNAENVTAIERAFGIPHPIDATVDDSIALTERLAALTVNSGPIKDLKFGASLQAIAQAIAARVYAASVDRYQGAKGGPLSPKTVPAGSISTVTHEIAPDGVTTTQVSLPDFLPQIDMVSLLDAGSRAVLFREAQG